MDLRGGDLLHPYQSYLDPLALVVLWFIFSFISTSCTVCTQARALCLYLGAHSKFQCMEGDTILGMIWGESSQDEVMRQVVLACGIVGGEVGRSVLALGGRGSLFDVNFGFPSFPKVFACVGSVGLVPGLVSVSPLG